MPRRSEPSGLRDLAKGNAIAKVCAVLRALGERSPMRLSEIAEATGLNRVTALRILDDLGAAGFVSRSGTPPRYNFGPEVVALSAAASRAFNIRDAARPSLVRLADLSGDTVLLSVRASAEAIVVDRVVGDSPIRANFLDVGSRRPLGVGGGSMALLAWIPEPERDAVLEATAQRLETYPRIDRSILERHIAEARARGHVVMYDIVVPRMGAVAVPVRDAAGQVAGAISIVALSDQIAEREAELVEALHREAQAISRQLGG